MNFSQITNNSNKYIINLNNEKLDDDENLLLLRTILLRVNNLVIKMDDYDKLEREYNISSLLNNCFGFMRYIIVFKNKSFSETKGLIANIYYKNGSMYNYKWNSNNFTLFKSLLKQIFITLNQAFINHKFIHNKMHYNNILLDKYDKNELTICGYKINTFGYKIIITDYEDYIIDNNYGVFYKDLIRLLNEIKTKLKLDVINLDYLKNYIDILSKINRPMDIINILLLIDLLECIET